MFNRVSVVCISLIYCTFRTSNLPSTAAGWRARHCCIRPTTMQAHHHTNDAKPRSLSERTGDDFSVRLTTESSRFALPHWRRRHRSIRLTMVDSIGQTDGDGNPSSNSSWPRFFRRTDNDADVCSSSDWWWWWLYHQTDGEVGPYTPIVALMTKRHMFLLIRDPDRFVPSLYPLYGNPYRRDFRSMKSLLYEAHGRKLPSLTWLGCKINCSTQHFLTLSDYIVRILSSKRSLI